MTRISFSPKPGISETEADNKIAAFAAQITEGTYTGDSTVNRAIPHGLGVTPKIVLITLRSGAFAYRIFGSHASIRFWESGGIQSTNAVTIPDATNFYVGNAGDYNGSANLGGDYDWVAIG